MIRINFDPAQLSGVRKAWWQAWMEKASAAIHATIHQWELYGKTKDNEIIWRDLKLWLLENVFHGKCAYCETKLEGSRGMKEADHYRPKSAVTTKPIGSKSLTRVNVSDWNGASMVHPGYFWLKYHWKNLLPSCHRCNTEAGKKTQFPTAKGYVFRVQKSDCSELVDTPFKSSTLKDVLYLGPDDLDLREEPALLHPFRDDPSDHILFGPAGTITPAETAPGVISQKGCQSIAVFNLDDDGLCRSRQKSQLLASSRYLIAYQAQLNRGETIAAAATIAWDSVLGIRNGSEEHSAAALAYVRLSCPHVPD